MRTMVGYMILLPISIAHEITSRFVAVRLTPSRKATAVAHRAAHNNRRLPARG